jgi:hypothetical protein
MNWIIVQISHDSNAARTFGLRTESSDFDPNSFRVRHSPVVELIVDETVDE